ncbi:MAG: transglutaminase family protein [Deltaproteobacteria bacterium]|nr:transglutaminase family protein [Deltaproteobacteria bacterium]
MSIRVALHHRTRYRYARPVLLGPQTIRLRPAPHNRTPIHHYSLDIQPKAHFLNWQQDPHGNHLARIVIPEKTDLFEVSVDLVADLAAYSPFDYFLEESAQTFPFEYAADSARDLEPFLVCLPSTKAFEAFFAKLDQTPRDTNHLLVETNRAVNAAVEYVVRLDPGVQTPTETLDLGRGSCRDSAWLLVQVLRRLGIAARFVSGYLIQLMPDQQPLEGPPGPASDFTDLHAWCECYVPGAGWIGLDPTSGLLAAEGHIPLAATPNPITAAPISGAVEKVECEFDFEMSVSRVVDRARVTKPYGEAEWSAVVALGDRIDEELRLAGVHLSVGGEPTFVSADEPDAPEWNVDALGGRKEEIADRLTRRLMELWAKGGVVQHGQGKWYPGEQLPRWAYACHARTDGRPLWRDPRFIAESDRDYGHDVADARRFATRLAELLGLERHRLIDAYEDAWYYLWRERRLPSNVDPHDARLSDPTERARLARIFDQGLDRVVGWILPLAFEDGWKTGDWFLRAERCYLHPGDSPMGFRLPLDSLPWTAVGDLPIEFPLDPSDARAPLADEFVFPLRRRVERADIRTQPRGDAERGLRAAGAPGASDRLRAGLAASEGPEAAAFARPAFQTSARGLVRTALCVEPRAGQLKVFLPPITRLEPWVELVAAIERTAVETGLPIQLEGYPPPRDPRLREFRITPDPGVIEVNVPPTTSWRESVRQSEELYDAARREHLIAEKFEIDGAHVGSGGGNHVVLGGLTPEQSPFLRRPDLLGSFLRFWHNHPSLSFLFSGRFIGPTSQAPRVDEARDDSAYELELALAQLPRADESTPPWVVDRILRNILVDMTGNTHRSEFCIDKLYSPDGPAGRLGLLELRAFEMPPHERMSCVQQLLVRALLARFWRTPDERRLIKWRTALHDQFMLPHWVESDFDEVLHDLGRSGYAFDPRWFEPHFEFRFPYYGEITLDTMRLELRGALEPWHVLGEESTSTGQARYVDSSVERLQVKVFGLASERYKVLCNGFEVPLRPTGTNGEYVAGIRYRAWQPPHCLHPRIPIHSPLHIDLYDTWNERSLAGCTYHVVHPGGRASEVRPINAAAAESRRFARFENRGHRQGHFSPIPVEPHPHFPHILDLRWAAPRNP